MGLAQGTFLAWQPDMKGVHAMSKEMQKLLRELIKEGSAFGGQIDYYDDNNNVRKVTLITTAGDSQMWVEVLA
jgi:hypothetical protein